MIYYVGFYSDENRQDHRFVSPGASDVFRYVFSVLGKEFVNQVVVINNAPVVDKKGRFPEEHFIHNGIEEVYRPFCNFGRLIRHFQNSSSKSWLFKYLSKRLTKQDTLIVYHSPSYLDEITRLVEKTGCRFILQVEEIYANAAKNVDEGLLAKEKALFQEADGFILASESLEKSLPLSNKPFSLLYGPYFSYAGSVQPFSADGKKHLVYAGTFDPVKGGALNALKTMPYLDDSYVLHILGFGDDSFLKKTCEELQISSKVIFEGCKTGVAFKDFLARCDVGLATQNPEAVFNQTSFPSKILTYLGCRLAVVSSASSSVLESKIHADVFVYEGNDPKNIALAIRQAVSSNKKSSCLIDSLSKDFCSSLERLVKEAKMNPVETEI